MPRAQSNSTVAPPAVTVSLMPGPPHIPAGTTRSAGAVDPVAVVVTGKVVTGDGGDTAVVAPAVEAGVVLTVDLAVVGTGASVPSAVQAINVHITTSAARRTSLTNPHATVIR